MIRYLTYFLFLYIFFGNLHTAESLIDSREIQSLNWLIKQYSLDWPLNITKCSQIPFIKCNSVNNNTNQTIISISTTILFEPAIDEEPEYLEELYFPSLEMFIIQSYFTKNTSYNLLSLLDNQYNRQLSWVELLSLGNTTEIPQSFPEYLPLSRFVVSGPILSGNITSKIFTPTLKYIEIFNQPVDVFIAFNTSARYPLLETFNTNCRNIYSSEITVDLNNLPSIKKLNTFSCFNKVTINSQTIQSISIANSKLIIESAPLLSSITLVNVDFPFPSGDFTVFPSLDVLDLSVVQNLVVRKVANLSILRLYNIELLAPQLSWFKNGFYLDIQGSSNIQGQLIDFGSLNPSNIKILSGNLNTMLYNSTCYTNFMLRSANLSSNYVPDCYYCYWAQRKIFIPAGLADPPSNFVCPIKLYQKKFVLNDPNSVSVRLAINGENLGYGDFSGTGLNVQVPNKNFSFTSSSPNGIQNITFDTRYPFTTFEITWGWSSNIVYVQAIPDNNNIDTKLFIVPNTLNTYFPLTVYGDGQFCNISSIGPYTLECTIKNYTTPNPMNVIISNIIENITVTGTPPLVITSISNITINGGNITIVGNFGKNPYFPMVTINGEMLEIKIITQAYMVCYVSAGHLVSDVPIEISSNGYFIKTILQIVAPPSDCSSNCNGNGVCVQSRCQCFKGYSGFYCESKTELGVVIIPDVQSPSPTVVTEDGFQFKFNLVSIQELDPNGVIQQELFTNKWNYTVSSNETFINHTYTIKSGPSTTIEAVIEYSTLERTVEFAGLTTIYSPNSLKLMIRINYWIFKGNINTLRVVMMTDFEINNQKDECGMSETSDVGYDSITNNTKYIKITYDSLSFYGRFLPFAVADKRNVAINNRVLNITTTNNITQSFIGMDIPVFQNSCVIDPDFSLLVNPSSSKTERGVCKKKSNTTLIIATVVSVVGAALLLVALIVVFRKRIYLKLFAKKLEIKLEKLKN